MESENMQQGFNPADIFNMFNGGPFNGGPFSNNFKRNNQHEDCIIEQTVTLEDLYIGKKINIKYDQKQYCNKCNGTGSKDGKSSSCNSCNGKGQTVKIMKQGPFIQQIVSPCDDCGGIGEKANKHNLCEDCHGNKYLIKEKVFELLLNKKMQNNNKLVVEHHGNIYKNGKSSLVIILKELPHETFKRSGNDLHVDIRLRLFQSIYGFTKMITHLDGRNLILKHEKMLTNMSTTMLIKNEGMGGHLYIHITTYMPKIDRLDEQENTILKKLLIKSHLSEYQKEVNIQKNEDKCTHVTMEEINQVNEPRMDEPNMDNDNFSQGVQCAQQ
jgi:DnaJ-class molecular chaperone